MNAPISPPLRRATRRYALVSALAAAGWRDTANAQPIVSPLSGNGPPINPNGMRVRLTRPKVASTPMDYRFDNLNREPYWVFAKGEGVILSQAAPPNVIYWSLQPDGTTWTFNVLNIAPRFVTAYLVLPGQVIHLTWPTNAVVDFRTRPLAPGE